MNKQCIERTITTSTNTGNVNEKCSNSNGSDNDYNDDIYSDYNDDDDDGPLIKNEKSTTRMITISMFWKRINQGQIPDVAVTTNDCTATVNGCAQYYHNRATNIADKTRSAHAHNDSNNPWYTFDYLMEYDPKEFEKILITWHQSCEYIWQSNGK